MRFPKFIFKAKIYYRTKEDLIKVVETESNDIEELKDLIDRADKLIENGFKMKNVEIYENDELSMTIKEAV